MWKKSGSFEVSNSVDPAYSGVRGFKAYELYFHKKKELINGNPSGISKSSDQQRRSTIQKLDTGLLRYIEGIQYYY